MNYFNPIAGVVNLREKCHAHAADTWTMPVATLSHIQCHAKQWSNGQTK